MTRQSIQSEQGTTSIMGSEFLNFELSKIIEGIFFLTCRELSRCQQELESDVWRHRNIFKAYNNSDCFNASAHARAEGLKVTKFLELSSTQRQIDIICSLPNHMGGLSDSAKIGTRDMLVQGETHATALGRPRKEVASDVMLSKRLLPYFAAWVSEAWAFSLRLQPEDPHIKASTWADGRGVRVMSLISSLGSLR